MHTVYLAKFTHKESNNEFYKIGYTSENDVRERFNIKHSERVSYHDFNIDVISFSTFQTKQQALVLESHLLLSYIKLDINKYLGTQYTTKNLTGITEFIHLDKYQIQDIITLMEQYQYVSLYNDPYITNYLGIDKKFFDNCDERVVEVCGKKFDVKKLKRASYYTDNSTHYRWLSWKSCLIS